MERITNHTIVAPNALWNNFVHLVYFLCSLITGIATMFSLFSREDHLLEDVIIIFFILTVVLGLGTVVHLLELILLAVSESEQNSN